MAKAYERQGNRQAAIDSLDQAIQINPNSSSYFYLLSGVCRQAGRIEDSRKAMESFRKLSQLNNELEQKRLDWFKDDTHQANSLN